MHTKERVIVPNDRRYLVSMAKASKAYAEATSSMVKFLITENDRMMKELQDAKQRTKQFVGSSTSEMKKEMAVEIANLEATMQIMYRRFVTMNEVVFHLYDFRSSVCKHPKLSNIHISIAHMQKWTMRYKGPPIFFHKRMKLEAKLNKAQIHMLIWNYEQLPSLITSIEASCACFFRSLDVIV